jgi:predicted esterase
MEISHSHPHANQLVLTAGVPLGEAQAAAIMVHQRGGRAEDILRVASLFERPQLAYFAPQAAGSTWYPHGFMEPIPSNQPWLDSALLVLSELVINLGRQGFPPEAILLAGFSQGACLATEFAARNARRYGGLIAFSGGLIGPPGTPRRYPGRMAGTPVFLGCSDVDFHIPKERVHETADTFKNLGAKVEERLYPNMGHTINLDEIGYARSMIDRLLGN